jgi:ketosteroid isomerase-like protein
MLIRRLFLLLLGAALLLPFFPSASSAQQFIGDRQKRENAIAAELDVDSQELVALEKETAHAMGLNNSSFFDRVYSDDYVGIAATGEVRSKSALVSAIQRSNIKYSTFVVTNIHVRVYGPSAVVTATWTARGEQEGRTFARQYRVIHVYVSSGHEGAWKVVAGQETMLPG